MVLGMAGKEALPTHIVDEPGAKVTRCGRTRPRDLPRVWAPFVQAHVDGWGMIVCPECAEKGWPTDG
jgi:hypothetical protein